MRGSTVNANMINCKFQDNDAYFGGAALWLSESTDDVINITNHKYQNTNTGEVIVLNWPYLHHGMHICEQQCHLWKGRGTVAG